LIELREVSWDHPDSDRLRADQRAELAVRYGRLDSEPGPKPSADDISIFFVDYDGTEAVGCGGLRTLDERHGEIKRMYVVPERRGTGVARAILRHLEVEARSRGWDRLVLETGDEQPDAMRFYEREGYTPIPNFGYYADSELSRCYERAL
jgi:GNAT superfamily N-acetyltransferase